MQIEWNLSKHRTMAWLDGLKIAQGMLEFFAVWMEHEGWAGCEDRAMPDSLMAAKQITLQIDNIYIAMAMVWMTGMPPTMVAWKIGIKYFTQAFRQVQKLFGGDGSYIPHTFILIWLLAASSGVRLWVGNQLRLIGYRQGC